MSDLEQALIEAKKAGVCLTIHEAGGEAPPEDLNAAPLYIEALKALRSDPDRRVTQDMLDLVHRASERRFCHFNVDPLTMEGMPSSPKALCVGLVARAKAELASGNDKEAMDDLRAILRMAEHFREGRIIMLSIIASIPESVLFDSLPEILQEHSSLDAEGLLGSLSREEDLVECVRGEPALGWLVLDDPGRILDRWESEGTLGDEQADAVRRFADLSEEEQNRVKVAWLRLWTRAHASVLDPGPTLRQKRERLAKVFAERHLVCGIDIAEWVSNAAEHAVETAAVTIARRRAIKAVVFAIRFKQERGRWPTEEEDSGFPIDPFRDEPMLREQTEDSFGAFALDREGVKRIGYSFTA